MPHKRAKRPVRERERAQRATDLAPKISVEHEPVPKSVSRVLDALQIRREYKKRRFDGVGNSNGDDVHRKKRRQEATEMTGDGNSTALWIKPDETVTQFNRRVENSMMPLIKTALRQSSAQARKLRREEAAQETLKRGKHGDKGRSPFLESPNKHSDPPPTAAGDGEIVNPRDGSRDFRAVSTSAPRRLNDIVQEPPAIKRLPRGATRNDAGLSMAQKMMIEEERDKVIRRYRELKARKLRENCGDG